MRSRFAEDGRVICSCCNVPKDREQFQQRRGGGCGSWCRQCRAGGEARRRVAKGIKPKTFTQVSANSKTCGVCKLDKPLDDFSPAARGSGGRSYRCKVCANASRRTPDMRAYQSAQTAAYRARNRATYLAAHRLRQFRRTCGIKAVLDGSVTRKLLEALYATPVCAYCEKPVKIKDRTIDHVVSLRKGGSHSASNLVMACKSCNSSKQDMAPEEFIKRIKTHASN